MRNNSNCAYPKACQAGACKAFPCPPLETSCLAPGAVAAVCTLVADDPKNCGDCNIACARNTQMCLNGACVPRAATCPAGLTLCTAAGGGVAGCANLQTDSTNCGACGNLCPGLCVAGVCRGIYYAAAVPECDTANPTFCNTANTENRGVCIEGTACP
jgi:hypothetical protein